MKKTRLLEILLTGSLLFSPTLPAQQNQEQSQQLLNVSYDVTREFYKDINAAFIPYWKQKSGKEVVLHQSHGGSTKQARSVIDGLEADVVTMNQATDINALSEIGHLIPEQWQNRLPYNSAPYSSTIVFLVRKGNPKGIKDWNDLIKPGVSVVVPNPKTSGNGRYSYLAAYGYALKQNKGDEQATQNFVAQLFRNVPVLDTGGRGATTTFIQRGIGDVLLTFESEVLLIQKDSGGTQFETILPSLSVKAEAPVTLVDRYVDKHGNRPLAQGYLEYLFSPEGQNIAAKHYYRPQDPKVAAQYATQFPKINLFTIDEVFGSWRQAQEKHFNEGGTFDQIYQAAQ